VRAAALLRGPVCSGVGGRPFNGIVSWPNVETTITPDSVKGIMVTLDVDDRRVLFIVLTDDGLVNRQGTGTLGNLDNDLFIGLSDEPIFEQLRAQIQPEWMQRLGAYGTRSKAGSTCTLSILFKAEEGREGGIRFVYGSESEGPPGDIAQFVTEAVRLTDPWHEKQRQTRLKASVGR